MMLGILIFKGKIMMLGMLVFKRIIMMLGIFICERKVWQKKKQAPSQTKKKESDPLIWNEKIGRGITDHRLPWQYVAFGSSITILYFLPVLVLRRILNLKAPWLCIA